MSFFAELKRRNVFRVGIAYAITAWLIAQIAGLAADSFGAPDWVMKMIITIILLGFPIAMVMAWAYEMTPEGLRRDGGDAASHSAYTSKLDRTITIALVVALAYFAYDKFVLDPERDAAMMESVSVQTREAASADEQPIEPSTESAQSIAVLPFVNMSEDAGNEYFADGLSEELLNLLVRIPELKVAARTSSFSYKGKDTKIAQIGEELGVANVLEGSVRKSGNHIRITAQLIKADDGFHLWSETFDRTLDDIFVTQDEIAAAVVGALKVTLLGELPSQMEVDPQAYALYLQGNYFNNQRDFESLQKAQAAFEQALEIDPDYTLAWIGIAITYQYQTRTTILSEKEGYALAIQAVEKALEIEPDNARAWSTLAFIKMTYEWDWKGAQAAVEKALQLEPDNLGVLGAAANMFFVFGNFSKARVLHEKIVEEDPMDLSALSALGNSLRQTGEFGKAHAAFNRVRALNPEYPSTHSAIGRLYMVEGDFVHALAEYEQDSRDLVSLFNRSMVHFSLGNEEESVALLNEYIGKYGEFAPYPVAMIYAWRGESDLAFEWLDKSYRLREQYLVYILGNWLLESLHSDPRFAMFLDKMGLLEYWEAMPAEYGGGSTQ